MKGKDPSLQQLEESLSRTPSDPTLLRMFERTARKENAWAALTDAWARAGEASSGTRKRDFSIKIAQVYEDAIGFPDESARWYLDALNTDPSSKRAFEPLVAVCEKNALWQQLIDGLLIRAGRIREEREELRLRAALVADEQLGDPEKAAELYEEVWQISANSREILTRLEEIYGETEAWEKLADTYERKALLVNDEAERVDLLRKLALLRETISQDAGAAADSYEKILEQMPDDRDTLENLERLYAQQEQHDQLVKVLQKMVPLEETVGQKVSLLERTAELLTAELDDLDAAIAAYFEILEHDPGHTNALAHLEELLARQERWEDLIQTLDRRIALTREPGDVLSYLLVKGDIWHHKLDIPAKAEEQFRTALELAPRNEEALDRLVDVMGATGRWNEALQFLLDFARNTDEDEWQASLFARMGHIAREHLSDTDGAAKLYEAALERVPDLLEALAPLASILLEQEQWARAFSLLEVQASLTTEATAEELASLYRSMGLACRRMGKAQQAADYYGKAYDREKDDLDTLRSLGELNAEVGNRDLANTYFERYLESAGPAGQADAAAIQRTLGKLEAGAGRNQEAVERFLKVLAENPADRGALQELAGLHEAAEQWEEAISYRQQLAGLADDPMEKWRELIAIGDMWLQRLDNRDEAKTAYKQAVATVPEAKSAQVKLLDLFARCEEYGQAVETLHSLASMEEDTHTCANYWFTAGTIEQEKLGRIRGAALAYEKALDLEPERVEVLRTLVAMLTGAEEWTLLERIYQRMLQRLQKTDNRALLRLMYRGLGELYELHLDSPQQAIDAYELAVQVSPDDVESHKALAGLYKKAGHTQDALESHRILIGLEGASVFSLRSMAALHHSDGRLDDCWFCLSALSLHGELTDREASFLKSHSPAHPPTAATTLADKLWAASVCSSALQTKLGGRMAVLDRHLGEKLDHPTLKSLNLRKKDAVDLEDRTLFGAVFRHCLKVLGVTAPEVYKKDGFPGLAIEPTRPPVLVAGNGLFTGIAEKELAFIIGKNLAYFHPWFTMGAVHSGDALKLMYGVAVAYVHPGVAEQAGDEEELLALMRQLDKQLDEESDEELAGFVAEYYGQGRKPGISRWLTALELSANHAGLLCCMDLKTAVECINADPFTRSRQPKDAQIAELVLYAVSESFAQARTALGLSLR